MDVDTDVPAASNVAPPSLRPLPQLSALVAETCASDMARMQLLPTMYTFYREFILIHGGRGVDELVGARRNGVSLFCLIYTRVALVVTDFVMLYRILLGQTRFHRGVQLPLRCRSIQGLPRLATLGMNPRIAARSILMPLFRSRISSALLSLPNYFAFAS